MSPVNGVAEGHDERALPQIGLRILLLKLGGDRAGVGERGGNGDAVFEAGEAGKWAAGAVLFAWAEVVDRDPEFGGTRGELEAAGKDADDRVGVVVESDGLTDDVGSSPEEALPGGIGQHDRARRGGCVVSGGEEAAEDGGDAEGLKETAGDAAYAQRFDTGGTAPEIGVGLPDFERAEDGVAALPVLIVGIGEAALRAGRGALKDG